MGAPQAGASERERGILELIVRQRITLSIILPGALIFECVDLIARIFII